MARLTLYGRTYCHLCEDMLHALEAVQDELQFTIQTVDVDADPSLEERFGERVPVLVGPDEHEICHYFLDLTALTDRLAVK
ncbi:MAG: glutaredoxin family protein [Burkholderiales bacterium]